MSALSLLQDMRKYLRLYLLGQIGDNIQLSGCKTTAYLVTWL